MAFATTMVIVHSLPSAWVRVALLYNRCVADVDADVAANDTPLTERRRSVPMLAPLLRMAECLEVAERLSLWCRVPAVFIYMAVAAGLPHSESKATRGCVISAQLWDLQSAVV